MKSNGNQAEKPLILPESRMFLWLIRELAEVARKFETRGLTPTFTIQENAVARLGRRSDDGCGPVVLVEIQGVPAAGPPKVSLVETLDSDGETQFIEAHLSRPLCGAKTRRGTPCQAKALPGKERCKLHGGLSTGPKTAAGRAAISAANRERQVSRISVTIPVLPPPEGMSEEQAERLRRVAISLSMGRTRAQVAEELGVTRRTVTRWQDHPYTVAVREAAKKR